MAITHTCEGAGCSKDAKLQCPTCTKLKLQPSYFCSQACFKQNWPDHRRRKHVDTNPWPNYEYTGALRPCYPLSAKRTVPDHIPKPDYALDGVPRSEQSVRKAAVIQAMTDAEHVADMRQACALARLILDCAATLVKPGRTTDEIDQFVHDLTVKNGAYPSPLNYHNFPKSCCTSVNEVICHGIPDQRPLVDGDIVNLDITVFYRGFHGDVNATYLVGDSADEESRKLVESARDCLHEAIQACRPGVRYRDLGNIITKVATKHGHQVVRTYCGHGINQLFHCAPSVPHYSNNKAIGYMRPGHTFTIEPMINAGSWRDVHWPDDWTAVTEDGRRSAQFEHTLLVTENGVDILTGDGVYEKYPEFVRDV